MKNKIMIMALAVALLVGLVPPSSVMASGVATYNEEIAEYIASIPSELRARMDEYGYVITGRESEQRIYLAIYDRGEELSYFIFENYDRYRIKSYDSNNLLAEASIYELRDDGLWYFYGTNSEVIISNLNECLIYASSVPFLYDEDSNLISDNIPTIEEYLGGGTYSFTKWCVDAGLNCQASSNESTSVIPYSYNDYWHIVRKTSNGKWLLTTIGNSVMAENIADYRLYIEDSGNLYVASIYGGENANGYKLNVRQYEYDADGWKLRTYETFDTREYSGIVDLGSGSGFDGVRMLAYTNVDIYVGAEYEPTYPKSTEYYEVTTTPPSEEPEEPSVTPGPSGGSVGGGNNVVVPDFDIDWNNVKLADIPEIIEQVKGAILGFFDIVGVVPLMIGAVFGFLPSWCLWMFGLSFALLGVLLVIKLIRG